MKVVKYYLEVALVEPHAEDLDNLMRYAQEKAKDRLFLYNGTHLIHTGNVADGLTNPITLMRRRGEE
jgi:hypothetical protein